jgi:hypothetical protein
MIRTRIAATATLRGTISLMWMRTPLPQRYVRRSALCLGALARCVDRVHTRGDDARHQPRGTDP